MLDSYRGIIPPTVSEVLKDKRPREYPLAGLEMSAKI